MTYYMLECWGPFSPERVSLEDIPMFDKVSWNRGAAITATLPDPIRIDLTGEPEDVLVPMFNEGVLVLRDDVIAGMKDAGVDDLQTFNAVLHDNRNGEDVHGYKVVNIIGVVAAADMAASDATVHGTPLVDVDFDSVTIDAAKARDLSIFRLAECVSGIVIHERVKKRLEALGIAGLSFIDPAEWTG